MDGTPEIELLRDLHEGRVSRNRDFEELREPAARRVWKGYRRLVSLAAELTRRPAEVRVVPGDGAGPAAEREVEVVVRTLRYRRRVRLAPWEFHFLRSEMGLDPLLLPSP